MKYLLLASAFLAATSTSAFAGTCNNGTLNGSYSFNFVTDNDSVDTEWMVGKANFSSGVISSVYASETEDGYMENSSGSGTYSITSSCIASGIINWTNGNTPTRFRIFLDTMDTSAATNIAYHGVAIAYVSAEYTSHGGEIHRWIGKF